MSYKMIFSDLDGTFFSHEGGYSEKSVNKIKELIKQGQHFVIASGRNADVIMNIWNDVLQMEVKNGCSICLNGAHIIENHHKKTLFTASLPIEAVKIVFAECHKFNISCHCYTEHYVYFDYESENIQYFNQIANAKVRLVQNIDTEMSETPLKIIANGIYNRMDEEERKRTYEKLLCIKEKVAPLLKGYVSIEFSSPVCLEFTSKDAGKGKGVQFLAEHYGISIEDTIAIGDGENDISMLKAAGLGIATANALPSVKSIAGYVTDTVCEEGAVAEAITKYFGI